MQLREIDLELPAGMVDGRPSCRRLRPRRRLGEGQAEREARGTASTTAGEEERSQSKQPAALPSATPGIAAAGVRGKTERGKRGELIPLLTLGRDEARSTTAGAEEKSRSGREENGHLYGDSAEGRQEGAGGEGNGRRG
jgi:hypothetical protein